MKDDAKKDYIKNLAGKLNAIILAHNYQPPEIQDVAHVCGDSLELSIKAAITRSDIIVFCGVRFMAETASILSPNKIVLLPEPSASCPMVDMVNPAVLSEYLKSFPHIPVVTYINSSAEIKAMSTICCTSSNATLAVNSLSEAELLMIPDGNLAKNIAKLTEKKIHIWNGCCPVHNRLTRGEVEKVKKSHPSAAFIAHPECHPNVVELADACLSTSGMIKYANESNLTEFIVGTETGIITPMKQKNANKNFFAAAEHMVCPEMKLITLDKIVTCLEEMSGEVKVPKHVRLPALKAIERMIKL